MDYSHLRKISLKAFVGFLVLTAVIAIIAVLTDSFNALQMKVISTTFSISAASVCAMICAAFVERHKNRRIGLAGIVACIVAALLVIIGIWLDVKNDTFWKCAASFITVALSLTHTFLLQLPVLNKNHEWVQKAVVYSIGILAVQILVGMWGEIESELYYRYVAVVSILVGLETLVVPILMKLRSTTITSTGNETIVLERVHDDLYKDDNGRQFRVIEENQDDAETE